MRFGCKICDKLYKGIAKYKIDVYWVIITLTTLKSLRQYSDLEALNWGA